MRKIVFTLSLCLVSGSLMAQLTLDECQEKARENYPAARKTELISQSREYTLKNASRGYLPQLSLSAKVTYQSDVTSVPISVPGIDIPKLDKEQYGAVVELTQTIWDGGVIGAQRSNIEAQSEVQARSNEVELYAVNERVNDLFFGVLLVEEQLSLNDIYMSELELSRDMVVSYLRSGVASQSDLDAVEVEILTLRQRRIDLSTLNSAYRAMLSAFIGERIGDGQRFATPPMAELPEMGINRRPEMALFEAYANQYDAQRKGVSAKNLPKLGLFLQGGYGNPGLNMFKDKPVPYAIGGVRLTWNFGGLYTRKRELRNIDLSMRMAGADSDAFAFNSSLKATQQEMMVDKYRQVMQSDERIVALRESIATAAKAKVAGGTMSVTDMLREIHSVQSARQAKAIHELELLKSIYDMKITLNN